MRRLFGAWPIQGECGMWQELVQRSHATVKTHDLILDAFFLYLFTITIPKLASASAACVYAYRRTNESNDDHILQLTRTHWAPWKQETVPDKVEECAVLLRLTSPNCK